MNIATPWLTVSLAEVSKINPTRPRKLSELPDNHVVSFVPMPTVNQYSGTIVNAEPRNFADVKKGFTYFAEDDVIFAKITPCMQNGKSAIARGLCNELGFGSTEFHVIRANQARIIPEWIWYFVRRREFRLEGKHHFRGAVGQQRVPSDYLSNAQIPLPPVDEQRRIVGRIEECLSRVDEIRILRKTTQVESKSLIRSFYHDLYHDLLKNKNVFPLKDAGMVFGGGTPSKSRPEFWIGNIPWISPKEMKRRYINDSSSLISSDAVAKSSTRLIKEPSVLFVVRGMILAHTFPVAVSQVPITLNQDMKAITPCNGLNVDFLATMLKGAEREILSRVEVAGHGTCRIRTEQWNTISIPLLDYPKQLAVMADVARTERLADELTESITGDEIELLRESILRKAFAGEL